MVIKQQEITTARGASFVKLIELPYTELPDGQSGKFW